MLALPIGVLDFTCLRVALVLHWHAFQRHRLLWCFTGYYFIDEERSHAAWRSSCALVYTFFQIDLLTFELAWLMWISALALLLWCFTGYHFTHFLGSVAVCLAGWLVAWLAVCLAGWLVGWLVGWRLAGWLAGWLTGRLAGWLPGWLPGWLADRGGGRRARGRAQGEGETLYKKKSGVQTPDRPKAVMLMIVFKQQ